MRARCEPRTDRPAGGQRALLGRKAGARRPYQVQYILYLTSISQTGARRPYQVQYIFCI